MSDWEVYQGENVSPKNSSIQSESDWEVVASPTTTRKMPESNENYAVSLGLSPFRALEDVVRSGYNLGQNIPDYYRSAKQQIPNAVNTIQQNPRGALNQAGAGIAQLGKSTFNTPHDVINYLTNRLNLFPQSINEKVQMGRMPEDTEKLINQQFGKPKNSGEEAIRWTAKNIPLLAGAGKLGLDVLKTGKHLLTPVNPVKVAKSIQSSHDVLEKSAGDIFTKVGKEAVKRNVHLVPLRQDLISDIAEHPLIPKTEKTKSILNKAYSGDYSGLRDLQSELWTRATKAFKSPLVSESNAAEELFELRNEINDSIKAHFKNTGNKDLANLLVKASDKYKTLKETYFSKETPRTIQKLVHPKIRKMPKNIMKVLDEDSIPVNKVKGLNRYAAKKSAAYSNKQNAINTIKKLSVGLGAASLGLGGYEYVPEIYNKLSSKE